MAFEKDEPKGKGNPNRDPITKEPGSHPVSTGVGAAAGGAAAGAGLGAVAGPPGAAAGIVAGAVVGGLAGKGVGEAIDPTREEAYWRERHSGQRFAGNRPYDEYAGAYRTGWEGYSKYGASGKSFTESEADLQKEYERNRAKSTLGWDQARFAAQAAWQRCSGNFERLIGYRVEDINGEKIGSVHNVWTDETGQPAFLGVKTGWLGLGKSHVIPVYTAHVNDRQKIVRVSFDSEKVKNAPSFDADADLSSEDQDRVYSYYGTQPPAACQEKRQPAPQQPGQTTEAATIQLSEEQLKVGKREVPAGGVRLRKIIRTEVVQQPVELKHEEIVVERVPASGTQPSGASFEEQDVFIPLRREEPVVQKESRVREEVRASKTAKTEQKEISEEVRKEDVEIEGAKPRFPTEPGGKRPPTERYEPKERGRNR